MTKKKDSYLNKTELSRYTGLALNSVREMIRDGRLKSEIIGRWEMVSIEDAEKLRLELEARKKIRVTPEKWGHMGAMF